MRTILVLVVMCGAVYGAAPDESLIGTWKAVPVVVNGEKIEREEVLTITSKGYEKVVGGEKRSGDFNIVKHYNIPGKCVVIGGETFQLELSKDLKTLKFFRVIPEKRIPNGVMSPQVGELRMQYTRTSAIPALK